MTIHSIVCQKLLRTNAHLGRRVAAVRHFNKVYIYGSRNGIAILNLDKTLICLRNTFHFMGSPIRQKGPSPLFLLTKIDHIMNEIMEKMASSINDLKCWMRIESSLFLTNSCSSPKKIRSRKKKINAGSNQQPSCVFILWDVERESSVILEADRSQVPLVCLVDSKIPLGSHNRITYTIPANGPIQFVYLFRHSITKSLPIEPKEVVLVGWSNVLHKAATILLNATSSRRIRLQDDIVRGFHFSVSERFVPGSTLKASIKKLIKKALILKKKYEGLFYFLGLALTIFDIYSPLSFLGIIDFLCKKLLKLSFSFIWKRLHLGGCFAEALSFSLFTFIFFHYFEEHFKFKMACYMNEGEPDWGSLSPLRSPSPLDEEVQMPAPPALHQGIEVPAADIQQEGGAGAPAMQPNPEVGIAAEFPECVEAIRRRFSILEPSKDPSMDFIESLIEAKSEILEKVVELDPDPFWIENKRRLISESILQPNGREYRLETLSKKLDELLGENPQNSPFFKKLMKMKREHPNYDIFREIH